MTGPIQKHKAGGPEDDVGHWPLSADRNTQCLDLAVGGFSTRVLGAKRTLYLKEQNTSSVNLPVCLLLLRCFKEKTTSRPKGPRKG